MKKTKPPSEMDLVLNPIKFRCPFCDARCVSGPDDVTGLPSCEHAGGTECPQWYGNTVAAYLALPEVIAAIANGTG